MRSLRSGIEFGVEWSFDNFVIVTGVGRSGTTILGKILEATENTFVLYEPVFAKYLIPMAPEIFRSILMEDYFLPLLPGNRRRDKINWMNAFNPRFVLKTLESQCQVEPIRQVFPNCRIIHAVRNGYGIIGSSVKRGWYSDDYLEHHLLDYVSRYRNCKIPWYIPDTLMDLFVESDQANRTALVWAVLVSEGIRHKECVQWSYEVMLRTPMVAIGELLKILGAKWTSKMSNVYIEIANHPPTIHQKPTLTPKVAAVFNEAMTLAGYEI